MSCTYKTRDDDSSMGLNNTICESKDYYCKAHRVYLSKEDVKKKKCMCKPTFDMISERPCQWLEKIS